MNENQIAEQVKQDIVEKEQSQDTQYTQEQQEDTEEVAEETVNKLIKAISNLSVAVIILNQNVVALNNTINNQLPVKPKPEEFYDDPTKP